MSVEIGIGLSTEKDPLQAIRQATKNALAGISNKRVDLIMLFASAEFAHSTVLKTIKALINPQVIIGCSSLGIISDKGIFKHGIILIMFNFSEETYFNAACVKDISSRPTNIAGEKLAEKLSYGFKNVRRDIGIIFCDGLIYNASGFLEGMQERLGKSFPIAGGSASDNLMSRKTYLFFNEEVTNDAACGILFGGKLSFGIGVGHGWKPLGKPRHVTRSSGNIVYEIDDKPAVQLYKEYLNFDINRIKKDIAHISTLYPLGVYLEGEDGYLLRNALSIDENGALILQGNIPEDSLLRLMIGTRDSCLESTRHAIEEAKKNLGNRKTKFVFVFESVSRYILLGRTIDKELETIRNGFGKNIPIIGFYTYGEYAPLKEVGYQGKAYFHNQSIAILNVGE